MSLLASRTGLRSTQPVSAAAPAAQTPRCVCVCARAAPTSRGRASGAPLLPARTSTRPLLRPAAAVAGGGGGGAVGGGGGSGGSSGGGGAEGEPHPLRVWTWAYAALLAAGGVAAYVKAGSTKSLTSAGGAALILALSGRTMVGAASKGSIAVCLALAVLLSILMANRYTRTKKLMPAGLTAGVSLAMSAAYITSLFA